jgi:Leucine-rich repeat (LRR) protein
MMEWDVPRKLQKRLNLVCGAPVDINWFKSVLVDMGDGLYKGTVQHHMARQSAGPIVYHPEEWIFGLNNNSKLLTPLYRTSDTILSDTILSDTTSTLELSDRGVDDETFDFPSGKYRRIAINGNNLTRIPSCIFNNSINGTNLEYLKHLELHSNHITNLPDDLAIMIPNVTWLSLHNNDIRHVPDLTKMQKLERVSMHMNAITEFPQLPPSIRVVSIFRNCLKRIPKLDKIPNIEMLSIAANDITYLDVSNLVRMPYLVRVYVYDNPLDSVTRARVSYHHPLFKI